MRKVRDIKVRLAAANELDKSAEVIESKIGTPKTTDDPKWMRRWATSLRKRAHKKERALEHKARQRGG
jgi:hypothetical protein